MPLLFSMAEHYEETVGVEETMNPYSRSKNERLPWTASDWSHKVNIGDRAQSQSNKINSLFAAIVFIIN